MTILRVALPLRLDRLFDYRCPTSGPAPVVGARVLVPFGRRKRIGLVAELADTSAIPSERLRCAERLIDATPLLPDDLFEFCTWIARYYHHPLGEVLATALPAPLREGRPATLEPRWSWSLTGQGESVSPDSLGRAVRQRQVLLALGAGRVPESELIALEGIDRSVLRTLEGKGWLHRQPLERQQDQPISDGPKLGAAQQQAVDAVSDGFQVHLLDGVTGSGKTEVYLHRIERVLAADQQVLVIVPEIGLTPQLMRRFRHRLGDGVAALHSALPDGERLDLWVRARDGDLKVIIGTRSAIFVPLARPGLVVVDEEHDASLKQQDGLRYSARDLAVRRAQMVDVPVILGSATPSLESLHNARQGRYARQQLPERATGAAPPELERIDLRAQRGEGALSPALVARIREHLDREEQVLLFLNRRGFSPVLMCRACGWYAECPRCDARMTLHRSDWHLRCHHCDRRRPVPRSCPDCESGLLEPLGTGTQRLETEVRGCFPDTEVLRMDRDTVRKRDAWNQVMDRLNSGRPCILLGTQMLAKGHDYPNITLVGVVQIDQFLFSSDFRAPERAAQLLIQVAGRAGRADKPGRVVVQTHHPDHPLFGELFHTGYGAFADHLLVERQAAGYPPYGHMALLRAEAVDADAVEGFLQQAAAHGCPSSVQLLGPLPAPMERRAGRYRMQILLLANQRRELHQFLDRWVPFLYEIKGAGRVRWSLDVDPADTF